MSALSSVHSANSPTFSWPAEILSDCPSLDCSSFQSMDFEYYHQLAKQNFPSPTSSTGSEEMVMKPAQLLHPIPEMPKPDPKFWEAVKRSPSIHYSEICRRSLGKTRDSILKGMKSRACRRLILNAKTLSVARDPQLPGMKKKFRIN